MKEKTTKSPGAMSSQELLELCRSMPGADEFLMPPPASVNVFRHPGNGKWFAVVHTLRGRLCVTLKLDPMEALAPRTRYRGAGPGWHMNKVHWNTADVRSDVPAHELRAMLESSHELTSPKLRKRKNT